MEALKSTLKKKPCFNDEQIEFIFGHAPSSPKKSSLLDTRLRLYPILSQHIEMSSEPNEDNVEEPSLLYRSDEDAEYVRGILPKHSRLELIYKASRDGWMVHNFHKATEGKGPTVTLIKSEPGLVCGGFTRVPWSDHGGYHEDA